MVGGAVEDLGAGGDKVGDSVGEIDPFCEIEGRLLVVGGGMRGIEDAWVSGGMTSTGCCGMLVGATGGGVEGGS